MIKRKNIIKIAIDSPTAAGAGTLAKAISKHYNLFYLDTGKIYRMIAYLKIKFPKKFNQSFIKSKIKTLKVKDLSNKFRELKSLIYDYRDKKEEEIQEININHLNFKNEIETNHKKYEKLIDDAADEISNFIEKAKLDNVSQ